MVSSVYRVSHRDSGRAYVGVTSRTLNQRWKEHERDAARRPRGPFHAALAKYGRGSFDFELVAELPTFDEAKIAEMIAIAVERPAFNLTAGGDGGTGHYVSPAARAAIGAAHRGKVVSSETRQKISKAAATRTEHIAKMIEGNIGRRQPAEVIAKQVAKNTGRKRSPETKAKISAAMLGNTNRRKKLSTPLGGN